MKLEFHNHAEFPVLAWGAVMSRGENAVVIHHGNRVEIRDDGFVEGAWNGPFDEFPPVAATVVCGSGGTNQGQRIRFWAGTDNVFPLYSVRKSTSLYVSNSPILALVLAGEEPDPSYPFYYDDFVLIARLGFNPKGKLRTASGVPLRIHFGNIVEVDRSLALSYHRFPKGDPIPDYRAYEHLLESATKSVVDNASSDLRRFPYEPLAACSGGYDANACAVMAKRAGCREAITISESQPGGESRDSGEEIARALGLACAVYERTAFQSIEDLAEFCVAPHAPPFPYAPLESVLEGKLLFHGGFGGQVWSKKDIRFLDDNRGAWFRFISGYGLLEYRLRVGFIVFPLPRVGSTHNRDLYRITHSKEMEPWTIGGDYDKPIARRIIEEAGIPRGAFAARKMAGGSERFDTRAVQSTSLGPAYSAFMQRRAQRANRVRDLYWKYRQQWRRFLLKKVAPRKKNKIPYTPLVRRFSLLFNRNYLYTWYHSFTFQYCFECLKHRYNDVYPMDLSHLSVRRSK